MSTATCSEPLIPALDSLGDDLLTTSRRQRRLALARPFIGIAVYGLASYTHLWLSRRLKLTLWRAGVRPWRVL